MAVTQDAGKWPKEWALKQVVKLIPRLKASNFETIISIAQKLIDKPYYVQAGETLKEYFQSQHPATQILERILSDLSAEARFAVLYTLMFKGLLSGYHQRDRMAVEFGFKPPLFFVVSPTMRCNLRCYGCYAGEYAQSRELSTEVLDRLFSEAEELGMGFITISGGEPFIRRDLVELMAKHSGMMFQVYSNGTLIDQDLAEKLAEMGNVAPMLSLEGFADITDRRRGRGHFEKVMAAMDRLREAGVLFGCSVCETRENALEISSHEFADLLAQKGVFVLWLFQYIPVGREPKYEMMPPPELRHEVRQRMTHIRNNWPFLVCDFWNDGPFVDGCIAGGRNYFHINSNGDVEPCVFVHFAVDNIHRTSLREALNSDFFKDIRKGQPWSENHLCPCMIIDNPHCLRDLLFKHQPRPTHEGAETIMDQMAPFLDDYGRRYHELADPVWERGYVPQLNKQAQELGQAAQG